MKGAGYRGGNYLAESKVGAEKEGREKFLHAAVREAGVLLLLVVVAETSSHAKPSVATESAVLLLLLLLASRGVSKVVKLSVLSSTVVVGSSESSSAVSLGERVGVVQSGVANVPVGSVNGRGGHHVHASSTSEGEVEQGGLLVVVVASSASASSSSVGVVVLHVLSLELGLDSLAVGGVANHRENGSDALDELWRSNVEESDLDNSKQKKRKTATDEHALSRLGVVKSGLDDVVGERVSEELLESVSVEKLSDEGLSGLGLGDSDALRSRGRKMCWSVSECRRPGR